MRNGMSSHQSARMGTDERLTPPYILEALQKVTCYNVSQYHPFDLDPCAPVVRPWPMATNHYTIADGGLRKPWEGRVWLNPPYGKETGKWLHKLAEHGWGTALIFARTDTHFFHNLVFGKARAILFIERRLHFHYVDGSRAAGNSGAPSCLVAYGLTDAIILQSCGIKGHLQWLIDSD